MGQSIVISQKCSYGTTYSFSLIAEASSYVQAQQRRIDRLEAELRDTKFQLEESNAVQTEALKRHTDMQEELENNAGAEAAMPNFKSKMQMWRVTFKFPAIDDLGINMRLLGGEADVCVFVVQLFSKCTIRSCWLRMRRSRSSQQ